MSIPQRLAALRSRMADRGIDAYLVSTDDYHCSEYVGDYFKCRHFISGFTGSAGTALITRDFAGLWTDGRYFIQAAAQLEGSGFTLMKMGQEGVPTLEAWLEEHLGSGQVLGFDARTVTVSYGEKLGQILAGKGACIDGSLDLIGEIWTDRPALSCRPVWELDTIYAGKSRTDKIRQIRQELAVKKSDYLLLASLADIAWLLNLRGDDVSCTPVFLSYLVLSQSRVRLFAQEDAFTPEILEALRRDGVELLPYDSVYSFLKQIPGERTLLLDPAQTNLALRRSLPGSVKVLAGINPTQMPKACKNSIEVANMRKAHIRDGVAVTKFICWLKKTVGGNGEAPVTELSALSRLEQFRREGKNYLGPSFDYIIAYGPHAAITHYSPSEASDIPLEPRGMVLADTGGHYLEGTTDITRTIVLGPLTEEEKKYFTLVLKGNLNLAAAKFLHGCTGRNLDYLAREPLWAIGEDYNHGTGHGVGYLLSVHEGPNGFRWKAVPERIDGSVLEEGMISSDEPGYYRENAFGIRHENMMVCLNAEKNDSGQFMKFDTLTMVPFDLDAVIPEMMTPREIRLLNDYHRRVFEKISPWLNDEERSWLWDATRPIG